jgi:hypothetical protein
LESNFTKESELASAKVGVVLAGILVTFKALATAAVTAPSLAAAAALATATRPHETTEQIKRPVVH